MCLATLARRYPWRPVCANPSRSAEPGSFPTAVIRAAKANGKLGWESVCPLSWARLKELPPA